MAARTTTPIGGTSSGTPDPFAPATLGPLTLRNRIIKAATFEGMASDGEVTDRLVDYHRVFAAGGVAMSTVAYMAVSPDGQGAPSEMVLRESSVPGLTRITDVIHEGGALASAQIGHAGPVGAGAGQRGLSASRVFSARGLKFTAAATARDLATVVENFGAAARVVVDGGFDAIELHMGHGYLLSSFMSPRLNRRDDQWGGSVANRARLARDAAKAVREAAGGDVAVYAKLNMADGVPGGLWLPESIEIAQLLEADGALDALELTGGSSFENPMYLFRGEAPIYEMSQSVAKWMRPGFKALGKKFLVEYPFEEAFFLPYARQFVEAVDLPLILLGGVTRLETIRTAMAEGFAFVAMARALLREPDLVLRMQAGEAPESLCIHCNKCMPTIYSGTHCVLVEAGSRPGLRIDTAR